MLIFISWVVLTLSQAALAVPVVISTVEPNIVTKVVGATDLVAKNNMSTLPRALQVRQWDWPANPAPVWTPPAQTSWAAPPVWTPTPQQLQAPASTPVQTVIVNVAPTPSYTWTETHNDDKNTKEHGIIAGVIIGMFVCVGFVGIAITMWYRRKSEPEEGSELATDVELQDVHRPDEHSANASMGGQPASPRRFGF